MIVGGLTDRVIRDIKFEKGEQFSAKFIRDFDRKWTRVTNRLRRSGADLSIPLVKR